MKNEVVTIATLANLIQPTGWAKKGLAEMKLDLTGLCGFGCSCCFGSIAATQDRLRLDRVDHITLPHGGA